MIAIFTIFPWMFPICRYNHKLVILFAYIWSFCQGIQGYELLDNWQKDFKDYCGIDESEAKQCLESLVTIGAIEIDELGICHPIVEGEL